MSANGGKAGEDEKSMDADSAGPNRIAAAELRRPPLPVPAEARAYVLEHGLHTLFNDLMDEVLRARPKEPHSFLASRMLRKAARSPQDETLSELREENARLRRVITYSQPPAKDRLVDAELAALRRRITDLERELDERKRSLEGDPLTALSSLLPSLAPHPIIVDRAIAELLSLRHGFMSQTMAVPTIERGGSMSSVRPPPVPGPARHAPLSTLAPSSLNPVTVSPAMLTPAFGATPNVGMTPGRAARTLTVVHFNDIYHTDGFKKEPVGSAARFATALKELSGPLTNPHVLFSGDAFSPSITATVTQGGHMPPVLNALKVEAACVGNHDLDFGVDRMDELIRMCNFPWLLTNVVEDSGQQLAGTLPRTILKWDGVRVGLLGIVEKEWIDTCGSLPRTVRYNDMVTAAREGVAALRAEGAHVVIALTHMRTPNDKLLAEAMTGVDVILGGHDHDYEHFVTAGTHVVKSGSDFRWFSVVTLIIPGLRMLEGHSEDIPVDVQVRKFDITSEYDSDPGMVQIVKDNEEAIHKRLSVPCAVTEVPIDARFATVRTQESGIGNWITDVVRWHYNHVDVEACVLQGGCMRADRLFDPGTLTVGEFMAICPIEDPMIVIEVRGDDIMAALNSAVSKYPALEGRFPQVSGIKFTFDPRLTAGARVVEALILSRGSGEWNKIESSKRYRIATSDYLARGNDGYDVFAKGPRVVDCEQGIILPVLIRRYLFLQRYGATLKGLSSVDEAVRKAGARAMEGAGLVSMRKKAVEKKRSQRLSNRSADGSTPQDAGLPRLKSDMGGGSAAGDADQDFDDTIPGPRPQSPEGSSGPSLGAGSALLKSASGGFGASKDSQSSALSPSDLSIATIRPVVEGRIINVETQEKGK
eukprot:TRINITY_DN2100_c5_g1_i1.p1 TRINITY_DN2100_c5_g1~~TRINITY_DN2100_c5_g1_i1.p1  ORF type:complete len:876 (+),score=253.67 TRINITY_DN2100_c5_g1_i1:176-2803(+)